MIANRRAHQATNNPELKDLSPRAEEGDVSWLLRAGATGGVVLLGGSSLGAFRLRVAQSHVRADFKPSFWSQAGILDGNRLWTVSLETIGPAERVVENNGVVALPWKTFDDPASYPNVAVLRFATPPSASNVKAVRADRGIVDVPTLMVRWLGYLWGADQASNPLLAGAGIPSAAFVESVYRLGHVDLTPGLAPGASCPEAIWQSAKWWRQFSAATAGTPPPGGGEDAAGPSGTYALRQRAALVRD